MDIRNPDGIWINSVLFSEAANHYRKYGRYCDLKWDSSEGHDFWMSELNKRINGVTIGGASITGDHYNYLNYTRIKRIPNNTTGETRRVRKIIDFPSFYDGDYDYFWNLAISEFGCSEDFMKSLRLINNPKFLDGGRNQLVLKARRKGYTWKNSSVASNRYDTVPNALILLMAYEKKYLWGRNGIVDMCKGHLDFYNDKTAWIKLRELISTKDTLRASYIEFNPDTKTNIEKGYLSQITGVSFHDDPDAGRGVDFDLGFVEEGGKFPNWNDAFHAIIPAQEAGKYKTGFLVVFGCVCAGTKVWTKEGRLKNIEDLLIDDGIIGFNGRESNGHKINHINPPAEKLCYKITTTNNNIIECSEDHPFIKSARRARTDKGDVKNLLVGSYSEAKNLKKGDYLLTISEVPIFGKLDVEDAYLYGLMIGDGYFKGRSISIDDHNIREFITNKYETSVRKQFTTKSGDLYSDLYIKNAKDIINKSTLNGATKENKRLPNNIHDYNRNSLALIIAGIFDSDGNVSNNKKKGTRICLTNISLDLLEGVKNYLVKFGIHSAIYKEKRNTTPQIDYKGQKEYIFRLYIFKDLDIEKFIENIPIKHSKKIQELLKYKKGNRNFRTAKILFRHTGECEDEKYLQNDSILEGYRFETIRTVECIGKKNVYNLNASGSHNYIANQFITGNTGGDMEGGTLDLAEHFYEAELMGYNVYENVWDDYATKPGGYFHPDYLGKEGFVDEQGNSLVAEAKAHEDRERKALLKANKKADHDKHLTEHAQAPSEALLQIGYNPYPVTQLKAHLDKVIKDDLYNKTATPIAITRLEDKYWFTPILDGSANPFNEYPIKDPHVEGCIMMYEEPDPFVPNNGYVAGYDPVNQDKSEHSKSIAAFSIYKPNIGSRTGSGIVLTYWGRPGTDKFNQNVIALCEIYRTTVGHENLSPVVYDYFDKKKKLHLLADRPDYFLKKVLNNSKSGRMKGCHMNDVIRDAAVKYDVDWMNTERDRDHEGNIIYNYQTITDIGLLKEYIAYDGIRNTDRVDSILHIRIQSVDEEEIRAKATNQGNSPADMLQDYLDRR